MMTSKEFKEMFNSRYVGYNHDVDTNYMISDFVITGIYQCLVNQEKIMKMLENK